ncbi:hypothetical protein HZC00_00670 [Candidatus Kaiserbacteria bacterium]|nr:hypothetical protein [Candidatus Kaiserbacteria bacterium]
MHEKVIDSKKRLIKRIVDRDADDDLGARATMREKLKGKSFEELKAIWEHRENDP